MDFGELVRTRRRELGLTLEEVAQSVGVDRATVLRWERGAIKNVRRDKLNALAARLCVPVTALLGDPDGYTLAPLAALPVCVELRAEGERAAPVFTGETIPVAQTAGGQAGCFLWRVTGSAMWPRILPGDLLVIRPGDPEEGRTLLVLLDGAPALRTLSGGLLTAANPVYPPTPLAGALPAGVVTALLRTL